MNRNQKQSNVELLDEYIDVNADIRKVYNQWTQFEDFPEFMEGIEHVQQLDDKRLHWVAKIGGKDLEWDAEIVQQIPDQLVAWRSTTGRRNDGEVKFEKIGDNRTRIKVQIAYEPEGAIEKTADALGLVSSRIRGDLERFKEFTESRSHETGAWRGEIDQGEVRKHTGAAALSETRSQRLRSDQSDKVGER